VPDEKKETQVQQAPTKSEAKKPAAAPQKKAVKKKVVKKAAPKKKVAKKKVAKKKVAKKKVAKKKVAKKKVVARPKVAGKPGEKIFRIGFVKSPLSKKEITPGVNPRGELRPFMQEKLGIKKVPKWGVIRAGSRKEAITKLRAGKGEWFTH
jgi:hypothetical protein